MVEDDVARRLGRSHAEERSAHHVAKGSLALEVGLSQRVQDAKDHRWGGFWFVYLSFVWSPWSA